MRKGLIFLILLSVSWTMFAQHPGFSAIPDMAKFREEFKAAAKKTNTIKADFLQEKELSMLEEKITSRGKFWFKKENMVRMEYQSPFQYLMVINKDKVFVKDGQKENTISTGSNKLFQQINRLTIDCVQGTAMDNPDFKTRVFENKESYLVELTPVAKGMKEFFSTILVNIEKKDYTVASIRMNESSGDNTFIRFSNKQLNTVIGDEIFATK